MPKLLPQPGRAYSFSYPRYNYAGIPSKFERRHILVTSVRDTSRDKLDPTTAQINPRLIRGRWLVTGQDLDKGAERSFYFESMKDVREVDQDEQPIERMAYIVIDRLRVSFMGKSFGEGLAFLRGARRGVLCGVLSQLHPE